MKQTYLTITVKNGGRNVDNPDELIDVKLYLDKVTDNDLTYWSLHPSGDYGKVDTPEFNYARDEAIKNVMNLFFAGDIDRRHNWHTTETVKVPCAIETDTKTWICNTEQQLSQTLNLIMTEINLFKDHNMTIFTIEEE